MDLSINHIFSVIFAILAFSKHVSPQQRSKMKCGLFEYYDEHMDNCGPCQEVCRHMEATRTQAVCESQCSDYLTAAKCTYDQWYDENVSNCAPCSEICTHHKLMRTTDQCFSKCYKYLKSLNCTEDEYFNDRDLLCSTVLTYAANMTLKGKPTKKCFQKCPKYVAKYPPGNIFNDPNKPADLGRPAKTQGKFPSKTSTHPGIIVTIVIGLLAVVMTVSIVVYWLRTRRHNYDPAPVDIPTGIEEDARDEVHLQMEDVASGEHQAPSQVKSVAQDRVEMADKGTLESKRSTLMHPATFLSSVVNLFFEQDNTSSSVKNW